MAASKPEVHITQLVSTKFKSTISTTTATDMYYKVITAAGEKQHYNYMHRLLQHSVNDLVRGEGPLYLVPMLRKSGSSHWNFVDNLSTS